jgi:tRNA pseudouridine13 synthase
MQTLYPLKVSNDFIFNASTRDFTVEEIPLYEFSGSGEHLIVRIRKKELTTWQLLDIVSSYLGIRRRDIGYAGLKDKHAMTIQHLSLPSRCEKALSRLEHPQIKILDMTKHANKIRIGHLKGNRFEMRLKKVLGIQKEKLDSTLKWIQAHGAPNYFGHQRFGLGGNNWEQGRELAEGTLRMRDRKKREFLIGAYQSYLFNRWLSRRMELNHLLDDLREAEVEELMKLPSGSLRGVQDQKHFFKLLPGDIMGHYPYGKIFSVDNLKQEANRFLSTDIAPTGLLAGSKVMRAGDVARLLELPYDMAIPAQGSRRYAWIRVSDIHCCYREERAHYELGFMLPKGSYATNIIEMLKGT